MPSREYLTRFTELVSGLAAICGREPSESLFCGYELALGDLPIEAVEQAVQRAARTCQRLPTGAELRALAGRATNGTQWQSYFGATAIAAAKRTCRDPSSADSRIVLAIGQQEVAIGANGPLAIWYQPDAMGLPPRDTGYVVGCAISAGFGDDPCNNSVAIVLDRRTGEQVAAYVTATDEPRRFAQIVVTLCKFFAGDSRGAYLIWRHNGPVGASFAKEIQRLEYANVYKGIRGIRATIGQADRKAGWWETPEDLADAFDSMAAGWETGKLICRDQMVTSDAEQYAWTDGRLRSCAYSDRTHGDRAVAMALAYVALRDAPVARIEAAKELLSSDVGREAIGRSHNLQISLYRETADSPVEASYKLTGCAAPAEKTADLSLLVQLLQQFANA